MIEYSSQTADEAKVNQQLEAVLKQARSMLKDAIKNGEDTSRILEKIDRLMATSHV